MEFTRSDKMASLIQSNYHLLPVIHRFGIRLGFRNKTVEQLCQQNDINTDFFIAIVNTFHNKNYFPEKKLLAFSPLLIIDYLKKTHRYYIEYSLPRIEMLLHKLIESIGNDNQEIKTIEEFYQRYKSKLLQHIADEESKVFPYIEKLLNAPENVEDKHYALSFEEEHEHVDLEIDDLKNLVIKYITPGYDELICNRLLSEIFRFENDILDHSRIEDAILIPQVQQIQKAL